MAPRAQGLDGEAQGDAAARSSREGAEFTGPSKADGYLDTPSPRRKIEPAHAVIKRNVKTQNMWKVMTGAPSDTTFTESEGSVMGSGRCRSRPSRVEPPASSRPRARRGPTVRA